LIFRNLLLLCSQLCKNKTFISSFQQRQRFFAIDEESYGFLLEKRSFSLGGMTFFHFQQQQKRTYMQTVSQQVISKIEGKSATIRPVAANAVIIAIAAIIQVEQAT
jgi:hypothetical protein